MTWRFMKLKYAGEYLGVSVWALLFGVSETRLRRVRARGQEELCGWK